MIKGMMLTKDKEMLLDEIYARRVALWRLGKTLENTKKEIEELEKSFPSYIEKAKSLGLQEYI
jgi:hypothetical protein